MKRSTFFLLALLLTGMSAFSQRVDSIRFFSDEKPVRVVIETDYKKLFAETKSEMVLPATVTITFPDSTVIKEEIKINTRGKTRKELCKMPPIQVNFKNATSPRLSPLKKLKLVSACGTQGDDAQYLLKEALAYKIFNILTDKSFRVRVAYVTYSDSKGKTRTYTQPGFFIEDVDAMAKRNKCKQIEGQMIYQEQTNREHMTLVSLFEYLIANADWSVPGNHNIKLIRASKDTTAKAFAVPYDFDYSGMVNTPYAIPPEILTITSVRERAYRGFPRTMGELQDVLKVFRAKKDDIKNLIMNFEGLSKSTKNETWDYLEEFFDLIEKESKVKDIFIDNARTR